MDGDVIKLAYNEAIALMLPDGRKVAIELSYLEPDEQLPELDIYLPCEMTANCFKAGLVTAEPLDDEHVNVLIVRQVTIVLED